MPHDFFLYGIDYYQESVLAIYKYSPDLAVITQLLDKATAMRLFVSYHSVPNTSTRADGSLFTITWFVSLARQQPGSSAISDRPSLGRSVPKNSRVVIPFPSGTQTSPTSPTPSQYLHEQLFAQIHHFISHGSSNGWRWKQKTQRNNWAPTKREEWG